jgi:ABC-type uncharacterized transport system ATPase subunit
MKVELKNIHKTFGAVHANVGINLSIPAGTIQDCWGERCWQEHFDEDIIRSFRRIKAEILLDGRHVSIIRPRMPSDREVHAASRSA